MCFSSWVQMSSCLMEVPGVIMTLCCYENKYVLWRREHKGNKLNNKRNVQVEIMSCWLNNTVVSHCRKRQCEAVSPDGCTLTPAWCCMLYCKHSIFALLHLWSYIHLTLTTVAPGPLSNAACRTNPQLCLTSSTPSARVVSCLYR